MIWGMRQEMLLEHLPSGSQRPLIAAWGADEKKTRLPSALIYVFPLAWLAELSGAPRPKPIHRRLAGAPDGLINITARLVGHPKASTTAEEHP
jgi:hypothetical protein